MEVSEHESHWDRTSAGHVTLRLSPLELGAVAFCRLSSAVHGAREGLEHLSTTT